MKRVAFNTTIDEDLLREIRIVADEEGRDINWYIEHLLKGYLAEKKRRKSEGAASALSIPVGLASL
jgi:hypothetical protein